MVVTLDSEKCMGCGVCVQVAPEVFSLDTEAGVASVILPEGGPTVKQAAKSCPVSCIKVTED